MWCLIPIWAADQLGNKSLQGKIITTKQCIMTFLQNIIKPQKLKRPRAYYSLFYAVLLIVFFIVNSCSEDDGNNFTPSASDILATIDENPNNGTTIGTVATNLTGTLNYTITSQSATGAFSINATSGVVTVNNASLFDYETSTMLTAQVEVTNSSETANAMVTVELNNIDDISFYLSTSKAAYDAATNGEWVMITASEYNALASMLNQVSEIGTSDALYDGTSQSSNTNPWTVVNDTGNEIPSGAYVFAFKYYINSGSNVTDFKVKLSETIDAGYMDLGNPLPAHSGNSTSVHFVLKGNATPTNNQGYLGFYKPSGVNMGFTNALGNYYFANNDVNSGFNSFTGYLFYQGLASTQKQWD